MSSQTEAPRCGRQGTSGPAKQRSTIMAPRGVPQPLGYGSLGSSCDVLSLAPFVRCAVCVIIMIANKYSITTTITNHNGRRPHDAYTIQSHEANNHRHGAPSLTSRSGLRHGRGCGTVARARLATVGLDCCCDCQWCWWCCCWCWC